VTPQTSLLIFYLVKNAVAPQIEKVIQGKDDSPYNKRSCSYHYHRLDLLKLSDETDLDMLNSSMEAMVEQFQEQLLPVASQLAARLVRPHRALGYPMPHRFSPSAIPICAWLVKVLRRRRVVHLAMT